MKELYGRSKQPNRLRKGVSITLMAVAPLAITACNNPTQSATQTLSNRIKPCPSNLIAPASSDGQRLNTPQNRLVAAAEHQADVVYGRVKTNLGSIVLNQNTGTSATIDKHKLDLRVDDGEVGIIAGYQANINISAGKAIIGIGALACNDTNGNLFETRFNQTITYFYTHTASFESS